MRLVDADALIEAYDRAHEGEPGKARQLILDAPTIEERKTGRWIYKKDLKQFFCDQCGEPSLTEDDRYIYSMDYSNFCPNCGADMRGEHDE